MPRSRFAPIWSIEFWPSGRSVVTALLCGSLAVPMQALPAQRKPARRAARTSSALPQISGQQKALHALNRLTFGPRPGDLQAVSAMGLEAWFQQQLHPETIDDSALESRLSRFPAMKLAQTELVERFPTPEMLRRYARGGLTVPDDSMERVIYADAALSYQEKQEARQAIKTAVAEVSTQAPTSGSADHPAEMAAVPGAPIVRVAQNGQQSAVPGSDPVVLRDTVLGLPPAARFQRLVAMPPEEMLSFQRSLKQPDQERLFAGMTPEQTEQVAAMKSPEKVVDAELLDARLLRDVYSERQVQAVMADFWLNHFSVYLRKNQNEPYLLPAYEHTAILPNALGRFEDLLVATAQSPAMLVYLDNWESVGPNSKAARRATTVFDKRIGTEAKAAPGMPQGINENYARELMELHTLGVNGGYTQQDVIEVAKCFTGWTVDRPAEGGEFLFNPNRHEPGDKIVLGHVIHEGGMNEGLEVLHLLATSPATAHFVSLKLAERFVSDAPPGSLVNRMSESFLHSDGDIRAVLITMFHSPEFWSPAAYRAKIKTPLEFVASALRATAADVTNPSPVVQALDRLGMPIYGMQTPNGYSWQADAWVSSNALLTRMNFALVLSGNRLPGTRVNWGELVGPTEAGAPVVDSVDEAHLETVLLGTAAASQTRLAVLSSASTPGLQQKAAQDFRATPASSAASRGSAGNGSLLRVKADKRGADLLTPESSVATVAGLLLGSPDFQRR